MESFNLDRFIDQLVQIQQIPAKTFLEQSRAQFILESFKKAGAQESFMDEIGNVYVCLKGGNRKPPLIVSAHLDTVFPPGTDLTIRRTQERISGPGIGDNSLGLAGLFGLYWALSGAAPRHSASTLPGDVWLVANIAEEGLGDLKGMKAVVDRFGKDVTAYIILEGMSLGQIYHRGLGVRRYRITTRTKGGHSWVDYGNPSAIHALAEIVVKITHLPLPSDPRTSLNVGVISGGTSVNTIASDANLELDIRSVSPAVLHQVSQTVEDLVSDSDQKGDDRCRVTAEIIGNRPAGEIPADHPLVKQAVACYASHGIQVKLNIGSTDTNVPLSRGIPAICVGLTSGGGAHTLDEYIEIEPIRLGMKALEDLIRTILNKGKSSGRK